MEQDCIFTIKRLPVSDLRKYKTMDSPYMPEVRTISVLHYFVAIEPVNFISVKECQQISVNIFQVCTFILMRYKSILCLVDVQS